MNNDCVFSEETEDVKLDSVVHSYGNGVDNKAFEAEVCNTFHIKENGTWYDNFLHQNLSIFLGGQQYWY